MTDTKELIGTVIESARCGSTAVAVAITLTPTSECRNLLTEANIHLLSAESKLKQALELTNG